MALSTLFNGLQALVPSLARFRTRDGKNAAPYRGDQRLAMYSRYMRAYEGLAVRGIVTVQSSVEAKRVKFNFCRPIVNMSAAWFAGSPVTWVIGNDPNGEISEAADAIWHRSGSENELLQTAILAGIYGDAVGIAEHDDATGQSRIRFVDPSLCQPFFLSHDLSVVARLGIAYDVIMGTSEQCTYTEDWQQDGMTAYVGEQDKGTKYSYAKFGGKMPVVWIPNQPQKGRAFGRSDLDGIVELVEEYDQLAAKQIRIVDYYAAPSIVFKGVQRSDLQRDANTVFYLPSENSDAFFLEWQGSAPDVQAMLNLIRQTISEVSEVPAIAFGQIDSGFASASGVSLKVLYGPLEAKTRRKRAAWGPSLERLMQFALRAEGYDLSLEDIRLEWGQSTPQDGLAQAQELAIEKSLGASTQAVLAKRGYSREQIEEMQAESEAAKVLAPGGPENPDKSPEEESETTQEVTKPQ